MGSSLFHLLGLLFTVVGLVLLIFANIGTTITSSFLPSLYLVEATFATTSIRFGPYNACILEAGKDAICTRSVPAQTLDYTSYGITGIDSSLITPLAKAYQFIVLIIPTSVLALGAMFGWLMIRKNRSSNRVPLFGTFASLLGMICGTATLTLVIVCYQVAFKALQTKIALVYHWGPSLYLLGVGGIGCLLVSFVLYIIVCLQFQKDDDYTYFQKDDYHHYGQQSGYY